MDDLLTTSIPRSVWWGWGDPAQARPLAARAWARLAADLGVDRSAAPVPPVAIDDVRLPDSRLASDAAAALQAVVGAAHVRTGRAARIVHAGGKSYADVRRLRSGDAGHAPDVVVYPGDAGEVAGVLAVAAAYDLAVVTFGGGTSVVGGLEPLAGAHRAVVVLDLARMNAVVDVDPVSRTATFQPGIRGPEIEAALRPHGLTLGHYPQSHQEATLGGYVATRSAGQASTGYGRVEEMVLGARLVTPRGELVLGGRAPASAAGPRLLDLVVGSEGTLGVITEATVRLSPRPSAKMYAAWALPGFATATGALRTMAHQLGHGVLPDVCRLSDPEETRVALALAGRSGAALESYLQVRRMSEPCLLVLVWEGADAGELRARRRRAEAVLRAAGGLSLPARVARGWEHGRFHGPYLREELLAHGVLAETLETATTWSNLVALHERVGAAITAACHEWGTAPIVQCHVSHVYPTGASLYFTVVAREAADPLAQWRSVKDAACRAIVEGGGTITHHHAIGTDHRAYLDAEIGPLGSELLAAIKHTLDPHGLLNPGKLVPEAQAAGAN